MVGRGERRSELAGEKWQGGQNSTKEQKYSQGRERRRQRAAQWVGVEGDLREQHIGRGSG